MKINLDLSRKEVESILTLGRKFDPTFGEVLLMPSPVTIVNKKYLSIVHSLTPTMADPGEGVYKFDIKIESECVIDFVNIMNDISPFVVNIAGLCRSTINMLRNKLDLFSKKYDTPDSGEIGSTK